MSENFDEVNNISITTTEDEIVDPSSETEIISEALSISKVLDIEENTPEIADSTMVKKRKAVVNIWR